MYREDHTRRRHWRTKHGWRQRRASAGGFVRAINDAFGCCSVEGDRRSCVAWRRHADKGGL